MPTAAYICPMRLFRVFEPFDHPDWLFEVKMGGFPALAHVERNRCQVISRNGLSANDGRSCRRKSRKRFAGAPQCSMANLCASSAEGQNGWKPGDP